MFQELISQFEQDPYTGDKAKERIRQILEHDKIFSRKDDLQGLKAGPGRPIIPISDLYGFLIELILALNFLIPFWVEVKNTSDLYAEHIRICQKLRTFFNKMLQRCMITGRYNSY